jgi:DNA adenine methylase
VNSFLRWVGGKRLLVSTILPMVPEHQCYVEACAGGAWVFFGKSKATSKAEVLTDVDGDLVNLYRVLQTRGRRLLREVDALPYSRSVFDRLWFSRPRDAMKRAVRFLYINRTCFGGKMEGHSFGVKVESRSNVLPNWVRLDPDALVERMRGVLLESMDVCRLIEVYDRPGTLYFVDPPYLGLSQPYAGRFDGLDHARLAESLRRIVGKFLLTCNDCAAIRRLYDGLPIRAVETTYSLHRGEGKRAGEIIVSNFDIPAA